MQDFSHDLLRWDHWMKNMKLILNPESSAT